MKINVVQKQIQGDRDYQQDSLGQRDLENFKLLILADGMGGYAGGEIASEIVVDTFMRYPFSENRDKFLEEALFLANSKIKEYKEFHPEVSNMGTTIIVLLIDKNSYSWISVGDSPLYLIRNNSIKRINENHSVAGMLNIQVERGEILALEAKENKNRHMLTSAILGDEISMINLSENNLLEPNDLFILASDGVETLSEDEILKTIIQNRSNQNVAIQKVLDNIEKKNTKNQDNATLMIVSKIDKIIEKKSNINIGLISIFSLFFILISFLLIGKEDVLSMLSNLFLNQ